MLRRGSRYFVLAFASLLAWLPMGQSLAQTGTKSWFLTATHAEDRAADIDTSSFSVAYYLQPQDYNGVWDWFGYIDTDSQIGFSVEEDDSDRTTGVGGEFFITQDAFINLALPDMDDTDQFSLGVGYVFFDQLKVSITHDRNATSTTTLLAEHEIMLGDIDYVGYTVQVSDQPNTWLVASRYFTDIGAKHFVSFDISHESAEGDDGAERTTAGIARYYFGPHVAMGVGAANSDPIFETKLFFSDTVYLEAAISKTDEGNLSYLELNLQF